MRCPAATLPYSQKPHFVSWDEIDNVNFIKSNLPSRLFARAPIEPRRCAGGPPFDMRPLVRPATVEEHLSSSLAGFEESELNTARYGSSSQNFVCPGDSPSRDESLSWRLGKLPSLVVICCLIRTWRPYSFNLWRRLGIVCSPGEVLYLNVPAQVFSSTCAF